jgi:hypothetical protein
MNRKVDGGDSDDLAVSFRDVEKLDRRSSPSGGGAGFGTHADHQTRAAVNR